MNNLKYDIFLSSGQYIESVYFSSKVKMSTIKYRLIQDGFPDDIVVQRR